MDGAEPCVLYAVSAHGSLASALPCASFILHLLCKKEKNTAVGSEYGIPSQEYSGIESA